MTREPAGFVTRLVAFFIDQLILTGVVSIIVLSAGIMFDSFRLGEFFGTGDWMLQFALILLSATTVVLNLLYYVGFWVLAGQTPGKVVLGLSVVRVDGRPLRPRAAVVRWLGYWLSGILFLGYLWILVDDRRQGWHDKLAGTLVVYHGLDARWSALPGQAQARWQDLQRRNDPGGEN